MSVADRTDHSAARSAARDRLREDGSGDAAVAAFLDAFDRLAAGDTGAIGEHEITGVLDLPDADRLPAPDESVLAALDHTVVIKLNGGLGTSMGLTGPKSLLRVRGEDTFLDLTARSLLDLRARTGHQVPLVLMDSFATRDPSLAALARHGDLSGPLPRDFLQNRVPKLDADTLAPAEHPTDPELTWAPPGHGDFYPALAGSGMLRTLLDQGFRYAFVSNIDNLGAVLDPRILGHVVATGVPFLMEVADRTAADRKGGHLARRRPTPDARSADGGSASADGRSGDAVAGQGQGQGGLVLREIAQTREADLDAFADTATHRYFNTNSLWVDLRALDAAMTAAGGVLSLPMIVNHKTVDPTDPASRRVVQLETAMGAAIATFPGAGALRVPRSRFLPVKTTNDLLVLRSDAYEVRDGALHLVAGRDSAPLVDLDGHFTLVGDFDTRFPGGPPSLVDADSLTVRGDVVFGAGVTVRGAVTVTAEGHRDIPDGAVLTG